MSRGINRAIIIGNLGQEPEVHKAKSGATITIISVATSEEWKDKQTGNLEKRTEWHKIKFFGKLADVVAQYVHKGSKIYVEGKLNTEKWQDNEGKDRYTTVIIGQTVEFLDSAPGKGGNARQDEHSQAQQQQGMAAGNYNDFDDNIDF